MKTIVKKKKVKLEWENKLNKNLQPIYSCNIKYTNYCHVQPTIKKNDVISTNSSK